MRGEIAVPELHSTNVRWRIMAMTTLTMAVAILGRLNLGVLGKYIQDEFSFSTSTMGWIFSAFAFAYHPFQIPGGWAGDRYGPRKVMTVSILFWSLWTAMMALVPQLTVSRWAGLVWSFALCRFLIGVGEAPIVPNSAKLVTYWMDAVRRGFGMSFNILGIGLGGALTPLLITWIGQQFGWRVGFYISSLLGSLLAFSWWFYTTDRPEQHPGVNPAELALIGHGSVKDVPPTSGTMSKLRPPWGRMLSSASVWGILLSYFCQGYMPYIYLTWFFIYLVRVRGLTMIQGSIWGSLPFIFILILTPVGGWFSDFAITRFGKRRGRQCAVWIGMGCSAILLWAGVHALNNAVAILMLSVAAGLNYFSVPTWWATCIDLTPTYSGSLSGLMNTFSGAWLAPILTAYLATHFGWVRALDFAALLTAVGALLWTIVDASKSFEEPVVLVEAL